MIVSGLFWVNAFVVVAGTISAPQSKALLILSMPLTIVWCMFTWGVLIKYEDYFFGIRPRAVRPLCAWSGLSSRCDKKDTPRMI